MLTEKEKLVVLKKIFSEDLEEFGKFFFAHHLKLETPDFHKEIYAAYQSKDIKIAFGAPRGHAKSTITDLVYLAWVIIHKKVNFVLLISDTYTQASLFLDAVKAEFESNDKLKAFYGNLVSDSWSDKEIICNDVMVKPLGAGMKVRGVKYKQYRPDLIIVDDLENDELVESRERRDKLLRWFNGALMPSLAKDGRIIVIGTILHYDSLLAKLLDPKQHQDWHKKTYQAINSWGALWPEHLSLAELEQIKDGYIREGQGYLFYQEYQNDPVSDENRKFKLEKFKYLEDERSLEALLTNTYIAIDRAYSLDKTADYTAIVVVSVDQQNNWYIVKAERVRMTEGDLIQKIFDLKDYYKPVKIGIEQKAFKWTIEPALKDEMKRRNNFFMVEELKDNGQNKQKRIEGLVPRFEAGAVYIKKDEVDLIDELLKFPKSIHDDLSDALAYILQLASAPRAISGSRQHIPSNLSRNLRPAINEL